MDTKHTLHMRHDKSGNVRPEAMIDVDRREELRNTLALLLQLEHERADERVSMRIACIQRVLANATN